MDNVQLQLKTGKDVRSVSFPLDSYVEYSIKLDPDEMGGSAFSLPGLSRPKFIAVYVEGYNSGTPPVEMSLISQSGSRVACTPFAVLTADTAEGMQEENFEGAEPTLRFFNWVETEVTVKVIAGQ